MFRQYYAIFSSNKTHETGTYLFSLQVFQLDDHVSWLWSYLGVRSVHVLCPHKDLPRRKVSSGPTWRMGHIRSYLNGK